MIFAGCVIGVALAAFRGWSPLVGWLCRWQFGPSLMRLCGGFALGALLFVGLTLILSFFFGRFYCSWLCPLGIWQDMVGFLSFRRHRRGVAPVRVHYLIAGISLGALFLGWNAGFALLDPYSNFGRMSGSFSVGGVAALVLISSLAVWRKRFYCNAICPVGTILGLAAKCGVYKLEINDGCVKCDRCVAACPAGCIDPASGKIDNARCVRCMNCLSICPVGAVEMRLPEFKNIPVDRSRRNLLVNGGVLLAGLALGATAAGAGAKLLVKYVGKLKFLPPGAGNALRFESKCTGCMLCAANCPSKIIVPARKADGGSTVAVDFDRGACDYHCNSCSQLCPTGALKPLALKTKQRTRIAEAEFAARNCIAFQTGHCGLCATVCPTGAIVLRANGTPKLGVALCIGCGACQEICPASPKAMTVHEIEEQVLLEK